MLALWHTIACLCQVINVMTITLLLSVHTDTGGWEHRWSSIAGYRSYSFHIMWLLPVFCLLSVLTHAWEALPWWRRGCSQEVEYAGVTGSGASLQPWLEYSVSAGLMTWLLAVLSGQRDLGVLCALLLLNVLLQSYGYLLDQEEDPRRAVTLLLQSCVLFVAMWAIIFSSFYSSLDQTDETVPSVVYAIIWFLFLLYCCFGLLPLLRWAGYLSSETRYQKCFIVLSTVSKTSLVWMVWFGAIRDSAQK